MLPINSELLKGCLDLILLALLEREPRYGYQVVKAVRQLSEGRLELKEGSLYPALHRLEQGGFVESFWQARPDGKQRRYYRITSLGRQAVGKKRQEWAEFTTAITGVLSNA